MSKLIKNARPTAKGKLSTISKTDQLKIQDEQKEKAKAVEKRKKSDSSLIVGNGKVLVKTRSSPAVTVPKRIPAVIPPKSTIASVGKLKSTTNKTIVKKEAAIPSHLLLKSQSTSKNNVMSTITNVTVSSPPSSASKSRSVSMGSIEEQPKPRERTRTRTIAPEESVLIKRDKAKETEKSNEVVAPKELVKDPVAFEINFEEPKEVIISKEIEIIDEYNYESDFESYESDFEDEPEEPDEETLSDKTDSSNDEHEEIAEAERTRMDSGNFDMSTKKTVVTPTGQPDSIDDTINSHDSGISYDDQNKRMTSPKAQAFYKRGQELMKKITFDEMTFNLFEMKPIRYDVFMQLYGQTHMEQTFTQTESQVINEEVQTDRISESHMWTQYPATFSKKGLREIGSKQYNEEKHGVGDGDEEVLVKSQTTDDLPGLEQSLVMLNNFFKTDDSVKIPGSSQTTTDFKSLTKFLQNAAFTISHIVDKKSKNQELLPSKMNISCGMFSIKFTEIESLKNTVVTKLYTNLCLNNVLLTIHKQKDNYQELICQWNIIYAKTPLKIFASWSGIECLEIHPQMSDFIIAGCNDGTIALWDVRESAEQQENSPTFIMPCEVVSLNESINNFSLINTVALKAIPERQLKQSGALFTQSHASQICSLHENGMITIWTILTSSFVMQDDILDSKRMYYSNPGSNVRLVKNLIIDLNPTSIPKNVNVRKSSFEKTRYYFENDLFDDKVLRELQEIDTTKVNQKEKLLRDDGQMFCDFELDNKEFLVATDSNYVLAKSRINFNAKERKIAIVEDSVTTTPTALKTHPIDKNILAVGLSNGNLFFVNNQNESEDQERKQLKKQLSKDSNKNSSNDPSVVDNILSKSCAIQNIVENERKTFDEMDELKTFLMNEALSEQILEKHNENLANLRIQFDKSIFNSFNLSSSVRMIEFTKNGKLMFLLVGKKVKIFNCWSGFEMINEDGTDYDDIKCAQSGDDANYLIMLTTTNEILINKLKN